MTDHDDDLVDHRDTALRNTAPGDLERDDTDTDTDTEADDSDELADLEINDGLLGANLRELLAPDIDLGRQTTHQVDRTLRARSALSTGLDLFGLGWHTLRTVLSDEPTGADGESEGT